MTIPVHQRKPNNTLRSIRLSFRMSQSEFAAAVREAGKMLGEPNICSKRLIQKWESGEHTSCRPNYIRALEVATKRTISELGFAYMLTPIRTVESDFSNAVIHDLNSRGPREIDRLRHHLEAPKKNFDALATLEGKVEDLFQRQQTERDKLVLPLVTRFIGDISTLLMYEEEPSARHRLIRVGGLASMLAGSLLFESDEVGEVHDYWDVAVSAAKRIKDNSILGLMFLNMSSRAARRGDPFDSLKLARTAAKYGRDEVRIKLLAKARCAQEMVGLRDFLGVKTELRGIVDEIGLLGLINNEVPSWLAFIDKSYMWAMVASVYRRMGKLAEAHEAAMRAIETMAKTETKIRALILAEVADVLVQEDRCEDAIKYLLPAFELAARLDVNAVRKQTRVIAQSLVEHNTPKVRALARRIAASRL